jgi:hypothetical protein
MKKLLASMLAVLGLTTAITFIGGVASAEPAQAATISDCRLLDAGPGYVIYTGSAKGRYATLCHRDYGLDEEILLWWFAKDGPVVLNARDVRCDTQYKVGC